MRKQILTKRGLVFFFDPIARWLAWSSGQKIEKNKLRTTENNPMMQIRRASPNGASFLAKALLITRRAHVTKGIWEVILGGIGRLMASKERRKK